ncbi:MAG: hypothetical protein WCG27_02050 [Pseudomonadota bacterium]
MSFFGPFGVRASYQTLLLLLFLLTLNGIPSTIQAKTLTAEELELIIAVNPGFKYNPATLESNLATLEQEARIALSSNNYVKTPMIYTWLFLRTPPPAGFPTMQLAIDIGTTTKAYLRSIKIKDPRKRIIKMAIAKGMGRILANIPEDILRLQILRVLINARWVYESVDVADGGSTTINVDYFARMTVFWMLKYRPVADTAFQNELVVLLNHSHVGLRAMAMMALLAYRSEAMDKILVKKLSDYEWAKALAEPARPSITPAGDHLFFLENGFEGRVWNTGLINLTRALTATNLRSLTDLSQQIKRNFDPNFYPHVSGISASFWPCGMLFGPNRQRGPHLPPMF